MLDGVDGLDVIELGCGTAYVSAWLARRGARAGRRGCPDRGSALIRDQFGMNRFDWSDATEFQVSHSETIGLLHDCGFEISNLLELRPAEDATTRADWITLEWARRWPCEDVWKARKST